MAWCSSYIVLFKKMEGEDSVSGLDTLVGAIAIKEEDLVDTVPDDTVWMDYPSGDDVSGLMEDAERRATVALGERLIACTESLPRDSVQRAWAPVIGKALVHGVPALTGPGNRPKHEVQVGTALRLMFESGGTLTTEQAAAASNDIHPGTNKLTGKTLRSRTRAFTDYHGEMITYVELKGMAAKVKPVVYPELPFLV